MENEEKNVVQIADGIYYSVRNRRILRHQDISTPLPPLLAVPPCFREDELYFELFCDYLQKTCDYCNYSPLHKLYFCPPQARKIAIIGQNSSSASNYSKYYSNYHDNSGYNWIICQKIVIGAENPL